MARATMAKIAYPVSCGCSIDLHVLNEARLICEPQNPARMYGQRRQIPRALDDKQGTFTSGKQQSTHAQAPGTDYREKNTSLYHTQNERKRRPRAGEDQSDVTYPAGIPTCHALTAERNPFPARPVAPTARCRSEAFGSLSIMWH